MSDNLTRYCAIREALFKLWPHEPRGNFARHLLTLAQMVSGIAGSRQSNLPAVASKVPGGQRESRIKRFSRWVGNDRIDAQAYFLPFARALLASVPEGPLVLIMDGSLVGRGCQALVISVLCEHQGRRRALPLVWSVAEGGKGHLSEQMHRDLVRQVVPLVPEGRRVIFLGDGEYNGVGLLRLISQQGWQFVSRIGKNSKMCEDDEWFSLSWRPLSPGEAFELPHVLFTEQGLGPVLVTGRWKPGEFGPLYLVTNLELPEEAFHWYKRRFGIETFFSDQKSQGFHLAHSHLSDPMRLARLMIATGLAYVWLVCLGARIAGTSRMRVIHRKGRCDLSLFQIGLLWVDHCLNEGLPILVPLRLPKQAAYKSVR